MLYPVVLVIQLSCPHNSIESPSLYKHTTLCVYVFVCYENSLTLFSTYQDTDTRGGSPFRCNTGNGNRLTRITGRNIDRVPFLSRIVLHRIASSFSITRYFEAEQKRFSTNYAFDDSRADIKISPMATCRAYQFAIFTFANVQNILANLFEPIHIIREGLLVGRQQLLWKTAKYRLVFRGCTQVYSRTYRKRNFSFQYFPFYQ